MHLTGDHTVSTGDWFILTELPKIWGQVHYAVNTTLGYVYMDMTKFTLATYLQQRCLLAFTWSNNKTIERFIEECNTQKLFIKQSELPFQPFTRSHTGPNFKKASKASFQQWKTTEGGERKGGRIKGKGRRESVQHMEGRRGHKTGEDGWSATPVSLQTGKRQRRVEPRNSAGHSAPQHATPCHHRTAPHLNS